MKRTSKVISIILSVFMLMQMMTTAVFAASVLPTNIHWGDTEKGEYPSELYYTVGNGATKAAYKMSIYKNNALIDAYLTEISSTDVLRECSEDFAQYIIENGSGKYSVKIGTLEKSPNEYGEEYDNDADVPTVEETPMSDVFNYVAPENKYAAPDNLKIENNILSYDYDDSVRTYHTVNYGIRYPNGEEFEIGGSGLSSYETKDISKWIKNYNNRIESMEQRSATKYDKTKAQMMINVVVRPMNILVAMPNSASIVVGNGTGTGDEPEQPSVDRSVISEKYYDAAKVCYDLGFMPKIYENYNQNVIGGEFNTLYKALTGETIGKDTDKELTFTDVIVDLVDALGYSNFVDYQGGRPIGSIAIANQQGITDGLSFTKDDKVTHEQLAQLVYNSLQTHLMEQILYGADPMFEITDNTLLYKLGYSKYTVNAAISGDKANVKGMVYNKANKKGTATDERLAIDDNDIKSYTDNGMLLFVKDNKILSGLPYYYAKVKINGGERETTNKNVTLNLEAYGYSKYKIGDGEYAQIPAENTLSYTLNPVSGTKTVNITFATSDESKTIGKSASIKLVNKHTVTYKVNGSVFETVEVDCGSTIPALDKTPSVDGLRFDGWKDIPETMPDEDIVIEAIMTDVSAATATGKCGENASWALSQDGTLTISGTGAVSDFEDFSYDNLTAVKSVIIGDGITSIGDYALADLGNCESVKIGKGVTTLGVQFMYGSKVSNVVVPVNVTEIKYGFCGKNQSESLNIYVYNKDLAGCEFMPNAVLYGYSDSTINTAATSKNLTFVSIDPDFAINGGETETNDKNVKISFNDYAKNDFKQYKINDGEYKAISGNEIDFVLDSADGEKEISITFKNDNFEITKLHKITFNNKHKITFKADGETVDEKIFGCGAEIPVINGEKAPSKDGYVFLTWDTLPKIMPDSDITVNAMYLKKPETDTLDSILTEEEKADGISVKSEITVADKNANIQTTLVNKYSKYTASIIINIDISKGKDDNFTPITETENLLTFTVDIPAEIQGKAEYIVLREHNGTVDALTTSKNADGEYIEVKDNTIIIHAKKFSAYQLIAKDAETKPSRSGGGGGGSSSLTVKFETNGAAAIKSLSVKRNNTITAPTEPVKDGFVFDGWYTDKDLTTKFDFNTKITKSLTLYAKWIEKAKMSITLAIGQKEATIDGKTVSNDVAPKIVNDRTMLPIRFIAESLGAKVDWIENSQTVKITAENIDISLIIGENFATVNGEKIALDSPSFIENDRTYLPIRFVSEKLGADVQWNETAQTVTITK